MCLIIQKPSGLVVPDKKLETAILNNGDGYGVSFPDGNSGLKVLRSAEKPDPEKLSRLINEELKDQNVLVHLRYTTAGETNLRNAHPFLILSPRFGNDCTLRMAHNGTISAFKKHNDPESDSRKFSNEIVRPLMTRLTKGESLKNVLEDPFTTKLLEEFIPTSSVLSFIDGDGNFLTVNATGNGGKNIDGVYYSNVYSFKENHRVVKKPNYNYSYNNPNYQHYNYSTNLYQKKELEKDCSVEKFTEKFQINVEDLFLLNDETIEDLCTASDGADDLILLVKELLFELKQNTDQKDNFKSQLKAVQKKLKQCEGK